MNRWTLPAVYAVLLILAVAVMAAVISFRENDCNAKGGTPTHPSMRDPGFTLCVDDDGRIIP